MNTYIQNSLRLLVGTLALGSITAQAESQFSLGAVSFLPAHLMQVPTVKRYFYLSLLTKAKGLVLKVCRLIIN